MAVERESLLTKIDQEIKPSPLVDPIHQGENPLPLMDGYIRKTAKQAIRYDASYYKQRKKRIITISVVVGLVVLVAVAAWSLGLFQKIGMRI